MIKTLSCIIAACDICGRQPTNGDGGTDHHTLEDVDRALSDAEGVDWWTDSTNNAVLCDERDEAHMARAREIHAKIRASGGDELTFLTYYPELDEQGRPYHTLLKASLERLDEPEPGAAAP